MKIPYPGSYQWLEKYFSSFANICGEIEISHFKAQWNSKKASQAFRSIATDAMNYDPRKFGLRKRSVDDQDFDNINLSNAYRKINSNNNNK